MFLYNPSDGIICLFHIQDIVSKNKTYTNYSCFYFKNKYS